MKTLLLKKDEVRRLIGMAEVIGAVEEAYKAFSSDQVEQPDYIGIHHPLSVEKSTSSLAITKPMKSSP